MLKLKFLMCFWTLCLLTACAPPKLKPEGSLESPSKVSPDKPLKATSVSSWEITGAMAARNSKKSWTASINWSQFGPEKYQIRLFGPLGSGTVLITKNKSLVTFVDGPKQITSHDADALLEQQTGVRLPVHDLYFWVRGLKASETTPTQNDPKGHLATFKEAGYTLRYLNYTTVKGVDLPQKIELRGHGVVIKLVIKHWEI